jgi:hypothetical protein
VEFQTKILISTQVSLLALHICFFVHVLQHCN